MNDRSWFESEEQKQARRREETCLGKLTWETRELAVAARAYAEWQHDGGGKTEPYQCQYCGKWHLSRRYR